MKQFEIRVPITGNATYRVDAESEEEAMILFEQGRAKLTDSYWEEDFNEYDPPEVEELNND